MKKDPYPPIPRYRGIGKLEEVRRCLKKINKDQYEFYGRVRAREFCFEHPRGEETKSFQVRVSEPFEEKKGCFFGARRARLGLVVFSRIYASRGHHPYFFPSNG